MQLVAPDNLACPLCGQPLNQTDNAFTCANRHSFDRARQGYVNLLPVQHKKSRDPGDSKSMASARRDFLNQGVYEPIAATLLRLYQDRPVESNHGHECILDAGCGEGYYLDYLAQARQADDNEATFSAIGLDISKEAILCAAKRNRSLQWIVGTNVHPPVEARSIDGLLCLFGFPSFEHFEPLLTDKGVVILADPGPDHLLELRELIYPEVRRSQNAERTINTQGLRLRHTETLRFTSGVLDQSQIQNLLAMTPHLYRASHDGKLAAAQLKALEVTVEVVFRVLERTHAEDGPR